MAAGKTSKINILFAIYVFLSVALFIFVSRSSFAATYYVATAASGGDDANSGLSAVAPWRTFARAFNRDVTPRFTAGDTLIILDGTYNESLFNPPSGLDDTHYSTIKAEHDGGVVIRGHLPPPAYPAGSCPVTTDDWYAWRHPLLIDSSYDAPPITGRYIQIEGIKFEGGCGGVGTGAADIRNSDHIKIFRCAFYDPSTASPNGEAGSSTFSLRRTHHILVEDSWAWGYGRYKFHTYQSDKIVYRRTVARHDWASTRYPQAVYTAYLSSDVEWQNAIAIDSDQNSFHYHATGYDPGVQGAFYSPRGESWGVKMLGSIALNVGGAGYYSAFFGGKNDILNSVVWHTRGGISPSNPTTCGNGIVEGNEECDGGAGCTSYCLLSGSERVVVAPYPPSPNPPDLTVDHSTIGDIYYNDTTYSNTSAGIGAFGIWRNDKISNSIITECRNAGVSSFESSNYNVFYDNPINHTSHYCSWGCGTTPTGTDNRNEDPGLSYIVRTDRSDGRGATIMNRIGVSGRLWGEADYNALTTESLWPWPNQDRIRADMRTFVGPVPAVCGNGRVEYGEECDGGDHCGACHCVDEPGWTCPSPATCRNGYIERGEECDDGNSTAGDGCENDCRVTPGRYPDLNLGKRGFCADNMSLTKYIWEYIGNPMPVEYARCGNGAVETGEECEDGNMVDGDGCSAACHIEVPAICGNSILETGEGCDDGNTVSGDGCDSACHVEAIAPVCGNFILEAGEECDDGNLMNDDGCDAVCHAEPSPICGNGILERDEGCDDNNTVGGDGCDSTCHVEAIAPVCGNGTLETGEECDDGNLINEDGCSSLCRIEASLPPQVYEPPTGSQVPDGGGNDGSDGGEEQGGDENGGVSGGGELQGQAVSKSGCSLISGETDRMPSLCFAALLLLSVLVAGLARIRKKPFSHVS